MVRFYIRPVRASDAVEFESYTYEPPYALYSSAPGSEARFLDPANRYVSVLDAQNHLWGFACFGADAQVLGGRYAPMRDRLDIGVGMDPARVGKGFGRDFCAAILSYAAKYDSAEHQVTIAAFNLRSQRVWQDLGFGELHRFEHRKTGEPFIQYVSALS